MKNIIVVTSMTPTATANYLVHALRAIGCKVFVCSDVSGEDVDMLASGAVDVAELVAHCGMVPDLLLFIEGGTMQLLPIGLENLSCLTAWYGIDTHMDYGKHLRIGRLFDVTFIAQKEYVERLRIDGLRQTHWLPLAFAPELMPAELLERCYDVAYVGSDNAVMHPLRHSLLNALRQRFPAHWFGMASSSEMGSIYAQSRIVFNKSVNNDVNMRYFEALGCGAVLVTDPACANGVEDLFVKEQHFFEYEDENSLIALVESLLNDPERLTAISEECRTFVMDHHTYEHRMNALLLTVAQSDKVRSPSADEYFSAFSALRMTSAALDAVAQTFHYQQAGRLKKFQACILSNFIRGLALLNRVADRISAAIKGR